MLDHFLPAESACELDFYTFSPNIDLTDEWMDEVDLPGLVCSVNIDLLLVSACWSEVHFVGQMYLFFLLLIGSEGDWPTADGKTG